MAGNHFCSCPLPGEWMKGKVIGSGSFGNVHIAMNKATGALFVVKSAVSCPGLQSLENEATILEGLSSPFIVQCMGKELSKDSNGDRKISIFMEYMASGSLSDVAEKFGGALDEEVIRLYTRQILCGLKYLHENGIVHCDLKCKNVLLGSSGHVKLTDFGCAKKLKDMKNKRGLEGSWQSVGGTPLWMAPEVLRNEGLDYASDIWSLGCTVIEMATGRPPWSDEVSNPVAAILKIACSNQMPRFPSHFSREGLDFLDKCLERHPKWRWTAEELLEHPFISGKSVSNSRIDGSCSPSSILDISGMYDCDYDSDEPGSFNEDESLHINRFSTRHCIQRKGTDSRQQAEIDLEPLDNWITVRSAGQF
ncbi:mitogen-activated protein kinase kinase kinase 17-like [Durio zibethinus]|uniref:Mitogen-activated protein kinase kinase kinase 17-like n=1 Tax=Durio zibethinus TaxID=66656 RepID=A0A6P6ACV2_DURZI|nr:mitogen-activated protein kinase kinase kinase 17-like [Durio zibethinus]